MATRLYMRNIVAEEPKPNARYSAPTPAYDANHYVTNGYTAKSGLIAGANPTWVAEHNWDEGYVIEQSCFREDTNSYIGWYRGGIGSDGHSFIGYATSTDGVTWTPYASNPILGDHWAHPYVIRVDSHWYMFVKNVVDGNIYLYDVDNHTSPSVLNGGNPVLTHSSTTTDWWYTLFNVAVEVVGTNWHMVIEGKASSGGIFRIGYSVSTLALLNWNTNISATYIISSAGNPHLKYIPERNALLMLRGDISGLYWEVLASTALMSSNLALAASWTTASYATFEIKVTSTHIADPDIIPNFSSTYGVQISCNYDQADIATWSWKGTLLELYDAIFTIQQDTSSAIYPCELSLVAGTPSATFSKSITEAGAAHNGWVKAFISPPLAAQTISGTIALVADFAEGSTNQNMFPMLYIYVWKADDSGQRGDLFGTAAAPIISTLEANTTLGSLQTFTFASYTLSSLAISAGDRIVLELSFNDNNTKTSAYTHEIGFNGNTSSGYESYIEFSGNLTWNPIPQSVTDTLALVEVVTKGTSITLKTATDVVGMVDSVLIGKGLRPTDVLTFSSELITVTKNIKLTDTLMSTDVVYRHKTVTMTDTLAVADTLLRGKTVAITDALTSADTIYRHKTVTMTDALASVDSINVGKNLKLTDVLASTDAIYRGKAIVLTDSLTSTDSLLGSKNLKLADVLAIISEIVTATPQGGGAKQVADVLALVDALMVSKSLKLTDVLALAELLGVSKNLKLTDALGLVDAVKTGKNLLLADTLHMTDNVLTHRGIRVTDVDSISDNILAHKNLKITDGSLITDAVPKMGKNLKLADVLALLDVVTVTGVGPNAVTIADTLSLSELISVSKALRVLDTLTLVDVVTVTKPTAFDYTFGLRGLLGQLIKLRYGLTVKATVFWNDEPREVQAFIPLVKVYMPKTAVDIVGLGYGNVKIAHSITIDIKARSNLAAFNAKEEVLRVLGASRIAPFTGYDFIEFNDGTQHAGYSGFYWWTIEVKVWQIRRPVS